MGNRHEYETWAITRLIEHLRASSGTEFTVAAEHVPVGPKDCDYLLRSNGTMAQRDLAVEVVRVVDSEDDMKNDSKRGALWAELKVQLKEMGVGGIALHTPWNVSESPRRISDKVAPAVARDVAAALAAQPNKKKVRVGAYVATRVEGLAGVAPASVGDVHWVNNPSIAGRLMEKLVDKDLQVDVPNAERIILAVEWKTDLDAEHLASEIARREDLSRLRFADRVYFVDRSGETHLVYTREVRDFFVGSGEFPRTEGALVDAWFSSRLAGDRSRTRVDFERVLAGAAAHEGTLQFLGREARFHLGGFACKLVDGGDIDDGLWVLRQLKRDADPVPGNADDDSAITTARGQAAWLAARLAWEVVPALLPEIIETISEFARDRHRGIRRLAATGIRALMGRRDPRVHGAPELNAELRASIAEVWDEYRRNAIGDGMADSLAETLDTIYDLPSASAETVARDLLAAGLDDYGALARFVLYFALARQEDTGLGPFDARGMRALLSESIKRWPDFRDAVVEVTLRTVKETPEARRAFPPIALELLNSAPDDVVMSRLIQCFGYLAVDNLLDDQAETALLHAMLAVPTTLRWGRLHVEHALRELRPIFENAGQLHRLEAWSRTA